MSLPVSSTWKDSIAQQFRYPAYLRVVLRLEPPGVSLDTTISTEDTESLTSIDNLLKPIVDTIEPTVTLEPNRWKGNGSMYLLSQDIAENKDLDWWSSIIPTPENPVTLTCDFGATYTFPGLSFVWDIETNSYPIQVTFRGTKADGSVDEVTVYPSDVREFYEHGWENISSIDIIIHQWQHDWRARIHEIVFGQITAFANNDIVSASVQSSSPILADSLPSYTFNFNLYNYNKTFDPKLQQGYSKYLVARQKITYQWGFETSYNNIEWMDELPMYLSQWSIPYDSTEVSISATNRLALLQSNFYKSSYTGAERTMLDVAQEILQNSSVLIETEDEMPWELTEELRNWTTKAPTPQGIANTLLQYIANYTGTVLDTNRLNGFIRFRSPSIEGDYSITPAQQLGEPAYTLSDKLKSLDISVHNYVAEASSSQTVYELTINLTEPKELLCVYNTTDAVIDASATITGGAIASATYYAHAAVLVIEPTGTLTTIKINGTPVVDSITYINVYKNADVENGLEITVNNPFITDVTQATKCANNIVSYYLKRTHLNVPYIGYPEVEPGDLVQIPDAYGNNKATVTNASITYNGGFKGQVEAVVEEVS